MSIEIEKIYSHLHLLIRTDDGALYLDNTSDQFMDGAFLHFEVYRWNLSVYKRFLGVWQEVKKALARQGFKAIYATPPSKKEEKLIKMFGLKETGITVGSYKLMRIELCQ